MRVSGGNGMKRASGNLPGRVGLSRFLQWRFNTLLIRYIPRSIGRLYLGLLGRVYFFFNHTEKEQIQTNLSAVVRRLPTKVVMDQTIQRTFKGIIAHYYEKLFIAYVHFSKVCSFLQKNVTLEGQQLLDEALSQGNGLILVTGHFGAVEFLPLTLALKGYEVTMVVRFKTERLKRALMRRTQYVPITLLDANNGEKVLFKALQALKSNQILITECDEFDTWRPYRYRQARFLGCSCPLDRTLDMLQRRYNSPVLMGLVHREGRESFGLQIHSLNGTQQDPENVSFSQAALQLLQQYIYMFPEQWYQWKQLRTALGNQIFEETRSIHVAEEDSSLSLADRAMHAY
jgi:KDO2-lipid IV(A) lauroyltransferase